MTRHLFYRCFYDPYEREWKHGNSRWDIIDLLRTTHALRPDGINWPQKDDGSPSFKLENLTAANGIEHSGAHDALADVIATIEMAKLVNQLRQAMTEASLTNDKPVRRVLRHLTERQVFSSFVYNSDYFNTHSTLCHN